MWWASALGSVALSAVLLNGGSPFANIAVPQPPQTARAVNEALAQVAIDPQHTFRVRDLRLSRGGVNIYLNEGILAFAAPIAGRVVAAVFTTRGVEAGDGEIVALPPARSERSSLADYTKSPNLNDHFGTAVFFFSDGTLEECLGALRASSREPAPDLAAELAPDMNAMLRNLYGNFDLKILEALLDQHRPEDGFFNAVFAGRDLGIFDFLFDPLSREAIAFGQQVSKQERFQLWTSYAIRSSEPAPIAPSRFSTYRIHNKIAGSLQLSSVAEFDYRCDAADGRALRFELSEHLKVTGASIDGVPAEFIARKSIDNANESRGDGAFLIVGATPLQPGPHRIAVSYEGEIIRRTRDHTYFVEERNTWYPRAGVTNAAFELWFECPESLRLVSTGELVDESVADGKRFVHRKTQGVETMAGFNLGEYRLNTTERSPYRVDVFADPSVGTEADLGTRTASILQTYTQWWTRLPYRSVSVTPIAGYFGQGFPGLIYLSGFSYLAQADRPETLRNQRMNSFFSDMLLPHEVAHQWWGNLVTGADYRASWISEAMSSHAALEYLAAQNGKAAAESILNEYRKDLLQQHGGKKAEAFGPVDFGGRLINSAGKEIWQTITYEKGTWVLQMLQSRLGEDRWRQFQRRLLTDFASRPLTNEGLRQTAAQLIPKGEPDANLQMFFDTWIYNTGIPRLALSKHPAGWELEVSGTENDFTVDVPISCYQKSGGDNHVRWVRAVTGTNTLPASENNRVCALPPMEQFLYVH